jgi:hypothetical protein
VAVVGTLPVAPRIVKILWFSMIAFRTEKYTRQYKKLLQPLQFEGKIPNMFNFSLITTLHTYWALVNVEETSQLLGTAFFMSSFSMCPCGIGVRASPPTLSM